MALEMETYLSFCICGFGLAEDAKHLGKDAFLLQRTFLN